MRKVFFITGPGRCGTKLLTALLDGNKKFHVFPVEVTNFFRMSLNENGLEDAVYFHSVKKICDNFFEQTTNSELKDKKKIYLSLNKKLKKKFKKKESLSLSDFLTNLLNEFYRDNKPVIINIHDENFLGLLKSIKNSKVIHLLRNPLTQINSRYLFRYKIPQNYDGFEFSSAFYRNYNSFKNAYISLKNKRVLIIKMENLLENTKFEIKKILKFMSFNLEKINLVTTKSGKLFDTKNEEFIHKGEKFKNIYRYGNQTSCLLPHDIYVISKIKYVKNFYRIKKKNFKRPNFINFYFRHIGLLGAGRTLILNPWRLIKTSIYSIYLFFLDKNLKNKFLKNQNI